MLSCWEREEMGGFACAVYLAVGQGRGVLQLWDSLLALHPAVAAWSSVYQLPPTFCAMNPILFNGCPGWPYLWVQLCLCLQGEPAGGSICNSSFSQYQVSILRNTPTPCIYSGICAVKGPWDWG